MGAPSPASGTTVQNKSTIKILLKQWQFLLSRTTTPLSPPSIVGVRRFRPLKQRCRNLCLVQMQTHCLPRLPVRPPKQQVGNQHANNVQLDAVFCSAVWPLQCQVLFHPFEQQLDLPALFVVVRNFHCAAFVVVRHQHQRPAFFARDFNAPQRFCRDSGFSASCR